MNTGTFHFIGIPTVRGTVAIAVAHITSLVPISDDTTHVRLLGGEIIVATIGISDILEAMVP